MSSELDRLVDRALSGYSAVEPPPGLEQRVLARVHARKSWGWRWAFAVPALASVAFAVLFVKAWRIPEPEPPRIALTPAITVPVVHVAPVRKIRRPALTLPKQEQFPAPSPITPEERALMAFVAKHPDEARRIFDELNKRTEMETEPLQTDGSR